MRAARALSLVPLLAHKTLTRARDFTDEHGAVARAERRHTERVRAMLGNHRPLRKWLEREGAGRLWLPADSARRWARAACSGDDLRWAEEIVAGRYSLLGAEQVPLGNPPHWLRDLYTGQDWPAGWAAAIPLSRGDGGDIRTVWELSRCYHVAVLAKAYWRTGEARFLETFRGHIESWLERNPAGYGPNWRSPMDAAIRAANWVLATSLFAEAEALPSEFWVRMLANLRVTARFISRHLEWHPVYRGNHYLSNAVGLVYVGALFRDDPDGARWLRAGAEILRRDIGYQVGPDGVSGEAAIGYHRLVTEFFSFGGELCDRNLPGFLPASYWDRVRSMHGFIADYLDQRGRAPLLGDADDGRLHMLCAEARRCPTLHRTGLRRRFFPARPPRSAAFPEGGFYVLRSARSRCVVRCGPVGLHGAGSHDHNDQLGFELALAGTPVISDSGTFAYTRDLAARFAFRRTAAHNAVQLGDEEQNPIRPDRPWRILADRTRTECTEWNADERGAAFGGRHFGYSHRTSGAICYRSIVADFARDEWTIRDRVEGDGRERLTWRTHLCPGALSVCQVDATTWSITHQRAAGYTMQLVASEPLQLRVAESKYSERYGVWVPRPALVATGDVTLPVDLTLTIQTVAP